MSKEQIERDAMEKVIADAFMADYNIGCDPCPGTVADALYLEGYGKKIGWISVDERVPDKQANFLIADDKGHMEIALWTKQFGWFSGSNRVKKVAHWMPLPEPPDTKGGAE